MAKQSPTAKKPAAKKSAAKVPAVEVVSERDQRRSKAMDELAPLGNSNWLDFVARSRAWLQRQGIYEEALLFGFTGAALNNSYWSNARLKNLFSYADRSRLIEAGDPLPEGNDDLTVYRGVAGVGSNRREHGFSWTLDLSRACWFASRGRLFGFPDPEVVTATIKREDVLAFWNDRKEREVICYPETISRLPLTAEEIEQQAKQFGV